MEKRITQFKHISLIFVTCIIIFTAALCGRYISPAFADTVSSKTVTLYEYTNIMSDLKNSTIGGRAFCLEDFPKDDYGKPRLMSLIEFGYSAYADNTDDYGLYVYVYNPTEQPIDAKSSNAVSMAFADIDDWNKYQLQYLNCSTDKGIENRFYKFKVKLSDKQKYDILNCLSVNERIYRIAGLEISIKDEIVDYTCAQVYTYTGYSKGYGSETSDSDPLYCNVDGFDRFLSLDVKSTVWRTESSGAGKYHKNQVNSVYFSVPDRFFDEFGTLQKITAEWYEYKTDWILVTSNRTVYDYMYDLVGKSIGNGSPDAPYYLIGFDDITPPNGDSSRIGRYTWGYQIQSKKVDGVWAENKLDRLHYIFYTTDNIKTAEIPSSTISNWIYDYKKYFPVAGYEPDFRDGKYLPACLFQDNVDSGRTRGYNKVVIDANDKSGLMSYGDSHGFWDNVNDFGFWNALLGKVPTDKSVTIDEPILRFSRDKYGKYNKATLSDSFFINKNDVDDFESFVQSSWEKDESPVLFRFAVTDYLAVAGGTIDNSGDKSSREANSYGAQETVFLDFDIIQLEFQKDNVATVIPVVSSPIDIIGSIEPPPEYSWGSNSAGNRLLRLIMLIVLVLLIIFVIWALVKVGVMTHIVNGVVWVVTAPFKAIAAVAKDVKNKSKKGKRNAKRKK